MANPEALALLLLIGAAVYFALTKGVRLRSRLRYPSDGWTAKRPPLSLPTPFRIHLILRSVALCLIVVAIARPQSRSERIKRSVDAIDMVICFDLSKSMEAIDFKPNRRAVAIATTKTFIDKRGDDRIGLVLFSGEAYMAVPMTLDHRIVKDAIDRSTNSHLQDGTAIGQSLAVAVNHLKESKAKSRVIVLVTDGDNNMGSVDPITAAALASGYSIKIYAIGIGKKGRVAFPITRVDHFGREIQEYQYLTDAANDELLQKIAGDTNGKFFSATEQSALAQIFASIDKLERTKIDTQTFTLINEKAWPWILAALICLSLELVLLHTRWRKFP